MLVEVAADVLLFLTREDLDNACVISKWFNGLIAQCCDIYPLRRVLEVALCPRGSGFTLQRINEDDSETFQAFCSMDEAVHFTASVLRHSYVECFVLDDGYEDAMTLLPYHWTALIGAIRICAVRRFLCINVDFSALDDDTFLVALDCRGLQSLGVYRSVVPSGFVTDDLLRSSAVKGVLQLQISDNMSDTRPRLSEDVVLDYCFPVDAAAAGHSPSLELEGSGVSEAFLSKLFERLQSSPVRPSGSLKFYDTAKQRGLSTYARYMVPAEMP